MSKLRYIPLVILTAGLFAAGSASAQTWYDTREANQQERIQADRANGSLTGSEYNRLENGEQRIQRYENYAERDGRVSGREQANLDRMLDRESHQIYRQSHDGQRAGGYDGWNHGNGWGARTPGIDRRETNQQNRIYNGIRNGSLTRGEAGRLEHGEYRIARAEARARSDGVVTGVERSHINGMLNRESRAIYRDNNNGRHR